MILKSNKNGFFPLLFLPPSLPNITPIEVDPVEYDKFVDMSLPIEELLKRDEPLIKLVESCTARRWAFTNAGIFEFGWTGVLVSHDKAESFNGLIISEIYDLPTALDQLFTE
ncbi:hypothetical protein AYI68_g2157 [Smittium mucronatum]|uniref:Uncharacterized protein n=1 Tax=Smittium mucronatum TaxID=133383 RepID=A0A1R0H3I3_9FUNG|nr:hypothetical protein AYI68_g2157 [Smittium mucronatum]